MDGGADTLAYLSNAVAHEGRRNVEPHKFGCADGTNCCPDAGTVCSADSKTHSSETVSMRVKPMLLRRHVC